MSKNLVLIGAGSAMFTAGIVADIAGEQTLGPWEIRLVDIDANALEVAYTLGKKVVEAKQANIVLKYSSDRTKLLPGADIVITTIGVGGRRAWEGDVLIPRKYGVYQPVGDTVGPGGISRAMRMIPAMKEIAMDILRLCPDALFINYSNPMTAVCRALKKSTGIDVVGLCIGVYEGEEFLANVLNVPKEETTSLAVGLNHCTWILDFRHRGKDVFPTLRERLKTEGVDRLYAEVDIPDDHPFASLIRERNRNPFCWSLFETYGAFPAPNDRHVTEFFLKRFPEGQYFGKTLGVDILSFETTIKGGDIVFEQMAELGRSKEILSEQVLSSMAGEHIQFLDIVHSMEEDRRKIYYANLPNRGLIPNLPENAVLEMPVVTTPLGLLPIKPPEFSDALAALINHRILCVELMVDAALQGDRHLMIEAMLVDGAVTDRKTAERMTGEMLEHHRNYLPQFS